MPPSADPVGGGAATAARMRSSADPVGGGDGGDGGAAAAAGTRRDACKLQMLRDEKEIQIDEMKTAYTDLQEQFRRVVSDTDASTRACKSIAALQGPDTERKLVDSLARSLNIATMLRKLEHSLQLSQLVTDNGKLRVELTEQRRLMSQSAGFAPTVSGNGTTAAVIMKRQYEEKCQEEEETARRYSELLKMYEHARSHLGKTVEMLGSLQKVQESAAVAETGLILPSPNPAMALLEKRLMDSQEKWKDEEKQMLEANRSGELRILQNEHTTLQQLLDELREKMRCRETLSCSSSSNASDESSLPCDEGGSSDVGASSSSDPTVGIDMRSLQVVDASMGSAVHVSTHCPTCRKFLVFHKTSAENEVDANLACERCGYSGRLVFKF